MRPTKGIRTLLTQEEQAPYVTFALKVAKARCPECETKGRLLVGPFYDRGRITCQECGHRLRVKVKV